jgi:uncharacterized membrane protein HdeD (DUF308 family)
MSMSLEAAAQVFREAMRQTVKRYWLWYLIEGVLLVVAGILAVIYPVVSSVSVVVVLGWLLIISGVLQGISLIGAAKCRISGCSSSQSYSLYSSVSSSCATPRKGC